MTNWKEARLTIAFPMILSVMLAVLYDVLQEVFKGYFSPPPPTTISPLLLEIDSKTTAGLI